MRFLWVLGPVFVGAACSPVTTPSSSCQDYCNLITSTCTGEFEQYPSADVCIRYCEERAALPAGEEDEEEGNTISCRFAHTGYAQENPPQSLSTHCPHAGPTGGDLCGSWCENYCHLALLNCPELFDQERAFCESECEARIEAIPKAGRVNDTEGNTIQCRLNHLGLAGGEEATRLEHCEAARFENSTSCVGTPPN